MTPASVIELRPPAPETAAAPSVRAIPTELSPATGCESASAAVAVAPAPLPELAAGQLWVVEISPHDGISALHRALITKGHVIIYDRSLEATVAALLPLGGYAEPASTAQTAQRCIRFTHDGWSVIRLVDRTTPAVRRSGNLWRHRGGPQRPAPYRRRRDRPGAGRGNRRRRADRGLCRGRSGGRPDPLRQSRERARGVKQPRFNATRRRRSRTPSAS